MNVSSVASSTIASTQSLQSPSPADQVQQSRKATEDQVKTQAQAAPQEAQKPQPVVNTQGQTTGRIVNTIA